VNESRTGRPIDALWRRHESPKSVWWFVLMYPVFVLAVYRRSRLLGGGLALSLAAGLLVPSPPNTDDAWATRVVRGERVWLDRGLRSSPNDLLFIAAGGVVNLWTLRAAVHRRPVRTALGASASMLLSLFFFDRMAALYETTTESASDDGFALRQ
jgi:hypothetical protein